MKWAKTFPFTGVVDCDPVFLCLHQVDVVCGDHLLDHYQSLKDIQNSVGQDALQVSTRNSNILLRLRLLSDPCHLVSVLLQDGLLVLHFGLVLPSESWGGWSWFLKGKTCFSYSDSHGVEILICIKTSPFGLTQNWTVTISLMTYSHKVKQGPVENKDKVQQL